MIDEGRLRGRTCAASDALCPCLPRDAARCASGWARWRRGAAASSRSSSGECGSVERRSRSRHRRACCAHRLTGGRSRGSRRSTPSIAGAGRLAPARANSMPRSGRRRSRFAAHPQGSPGGSCAGCRSALPHSAVVAWCDPLYPPALRQLADPPLCLFVRAACDGQEIARGLGVLCDGRRRSRSWVRGRRPPTVTEMAAAPGPRPHRPRASWSSAVSALGIDADGAGRGDRRGEGRAGADTVAVLGCGADVVYPQANARLRDEVARRGLLVSEFAWGVPARPWRFPARNRVMAALSRGVVVVEGASRSGARITADFALELGSRSARRARRGGEEAHGGAARSPAPRCAPSASRRTTSWLPSPPCLSAPSRWPVDLDTSCGCAASGEGLRQRQGLRRAPGAGARTDDGRPGGQGLWGPRLRGERAPQRARSRRAGDADRRRSVPTPAKVNPRTLGRNSLTCLAL